MDAVERCRRYVGRLEGAISGSWGHNAAIHAACVCVYRSAAQIRAPKVRGNGKEGR